MGNKNTKSEPKKSDEEIMRERWLNLANNDNSKRESNEESVKKEENVKEVESRVFKR